MLGIDASKQQSIVRRHLIRQPPKGNEGWKCQSSVVMSVKPRTIGLKELRDRLLGAASSQAEMLVCAAMLEGFSLGPMGCARVMNGDFVKLLKPRMFREVMYEGLDDRDRALLPPSLPVRAPGTAFSGA